MKQQNPFYQLFLLILFALASCQQTVYLENESETEKVPVYFSGSIQTRVSGTTWETSDRIGVFMVSAGSTLNSSNVIDDSSNRKYVYETDSFVPSTSNDTLFYPTKDKVDFIAYYPYRAIKDFKATLDVSNQASQTAIDFLYSNNLTNVSRTNKKVSLTFQHKLSKLQFNIEPGEGYTASDLKGMRLVLEDVVSQATLNLADGSITTDSDVSNVNITSSINEAGTVADLIIIPQQATKKTVRLTLASRRSYTFELETITWASGTSYTYNLTLNNDYISVPVLDAVIEDWKEGDSSSATQNEGSTLDTSIWNGTVDDEWYDAELTTFSLTKASELAGLASLVNNGTTFEGKTVQLLNGIDLDGKAWTPVGNSEDVSFKGVFNGNGYTISHIAPSSSSTYMGLFGNNQGTIKNVIISGDFTLKETETQKTFRLGLLVASNAGKIDNCRSYSSLQYTFNLTLDSTAPTLSIGGLIGKNEGTVSNCQNCGQISSTLSTNTTTLTSYNYVGGIVGVNAGTVTKCENDQNLYVTGGRVSVGGVVGFNYNNGSLKGNVSSCENFGEIFGETSTLSVSAGGILGMQDAKGGSISDCYNCSAVKSKSSIKAGSAISGGIIGSNRTTVLRCVNDGTVSASNSGSAASAYAGGIVGTNTDSGEIHTCENGLTAIVESTGSYAGIAGYNRDSKVYSCCTNKGTPLRWINTGSDTNAKKDVDTTSHEDDK